MFAPHPPCLEPKTGHGAPGERVPAPHHAVTLILDFRFQTARNTKTKTISFVYTTSLWCLVMAARANACEGFNGGSWETFSALLDTPQGVSFSPHTPTSTEVTPTASCTHPHPTREASFGTQLTVRTEQAHGARILIKWCLKPVLLLNFLF